MDEGTRVLKRYFRREIVSLNIYLIGTGCGTGSLTKEAADILSRAEFLIGAERLIGMFPDSFEKKAATRPEEILSAIQQFEKQNSGRPEKTAGQGNISVLFSGDSGFYSGTRRLLPLLEGYEVKILPGISSLQLLSARCGRPWQEWRLCSAHGLDCDAVKEVCGGRPVFFLTGGKLGPSQLCEQLKEAGLDALPVVVGENLGTDGEKIQRGTAGEFAGKEFAALSVMLADAAPRFSRRAPGLPDEAFERTERVPMTKQFVRAAIMAKLAPGMEEICWDVGTGSGSVAVELALQAGAVYSVERNAEALELAERNRRALGAWNLRLVQGSAPESLRGLPAPDAVFVGGSGGNLREILELVQKKNGRARICISAVTVETLSKAVTILKELGYETDAVQIGISQSRKAAGLHMMTAQNPVWLICGEPSFSSGECL